jgi:C4-type Zn-finger protein
MLNYSMGFLGDEETEKIMQHIAECRSCAFRVLEVTRAGEEMKKEILEWVDADPQARS